MRITDNDRIVNTASAIVQELRMACTRYRNFFKNGLPLEAGDGMAAIKVTPEQLRTALGENAKALEIVCEFVLDGKSNKITQALKEEKPKPPKT